jgi:D-lactate dehydrogenase
MANRVVERLWHWSGEGELPVVTDASSCALGLSAELVPALTDENRARHGAITVLDSIAWAHDELIPRLSPSRKLRSAVVHPTCATRHLGLTRELEELAAVIADEVTIPVEATCCGFAGDRGFLHPELTEAAVRPQAEQVRAGGFEAHLCSNRTCEVGLERGTGARYESFVLALEELTREG